MIVSVVIPCRNEVAFIQECIAAIYANQLDTSIFLNVFVIDGMSDDGTRERIQSLQSKYPSLKLIDNVKQVTPYAFNLGIHAATADYIQIVGARHILSSNYIQQSLAILNSKPDVWCVGGKLINEYINETSEIISKAMSTSFGMGIGNFRTLAKSGYTDTVTSPMYPFWVFEKIGFFDEQLIRNQDDDFNFRVTKAGGKIYFENDIHLKYYVRGSYSGLYRQFYQYGYWKVFVNQKHKAVTTFRQLIPPLFVSFIFLSLILSMLHPLFAVLSFLVYLVYSFLALLMGFKKGKKPTESLQIAMTFPIMHFSYGLGYLKGILDFVILKKKPSDKQKRLSR
jgi:GT2 family glycosyltransferase